MIVPKQAEQTSRELFFDRGHEGLTLLSLRLRLRVDWFYTQLGIDDGLFKLASPQEVADHVEVRVFSHGCSLFFSNRPLEHKADHSRHLQSLYGAKVQAHASHKDYLEIKLEKESEVRPFLVLVVAFAVPR